MNLSDLGWTDPLALAFADLRLSTCRPFRVCREERTGYCVHDGAAERFATVSGRLRGAAVDATEWPAVGDWVAVEPTPDGRGVIHAVLPRRSAFVRQVAGRRSDTQVVAANVDTVFLVSGLDGDFNPRRVERYLTLAYGSGAAPVVLLNKADVCPDVEARLQEVEAASPGTPVHAISALGGDGLDVVRRWLAPGRTVAVLGSSGVGKSTLINALLGENRQRTSAVRDGDDRGRHTTTRRELFVVATGGIVIDTPGMRELHLAGSGEGLGAAFEDIAALADACRFRDCGHAHEPGCAVRAAIERGELPAERLASLHKLRRELEYEAARSDARLQRERTDRWKRIHKAARKRLKHKRT